MEGYCRGCLVKYDEPTDLLQYTEKNRRLYIYSTGLQVKRTDQIPFQLCKECYSNMVQSCRFKKQCRISDKRLKNYFAMKDTSDSQDFSTFLKNNDDLLLKFPGLIGYSTPANQKAREDDNESTSTSIRNFMQDLVPAEELADADASIVRELIQEEADILEDSLDSRWLEDDGMSQYRLDLSISPFRTPHSTGERFFTQQNLGLNFLDMSQDREKINDIAKEIMNELGPKDGISLGIDSDINIKTNNLIVSNKELPDLDIDSNIEKIVFECSGKKIKSGKENLIDLNDIEQIHKDATLDDHVRSLVKRATKGSKFEEIGKGKNLYNFDKTETRGKNMKLMKLLAENLDDDASDVSENEQTKEELKEDEQNKEEDINKLNASDVTENYQENEQTKEELKEDEQNKEENINKLNFYVECEEPKDEGDKDVIDKNLDVALKSGEAQEYFLDDLIYTPPAPNCATAMSTPTLNQILFGKTPDYGNKTPKSPGQYLQKCKDTASDIDIFEDFYYKETDVAKIENNSDSVSKEENNSDSVFKVPIAPGAYDLEDFYCKICDKKFRGEKGIKMHARKRHAEQIELPKIKKKRMKMKIVCDICGKEFFDRSGLTRHIHSMHKKEEVAGPSGPSICKVCSLPFTCDTKLRLHLRRVHNDKDSSPQKPKRLYVCPLCGATTPYSSNHRVHMARHNKTFTMYCSKCDKGFYRKSDLETHERSHLGIKLYACPQCEKTYARRDWLNTHLKKHNDELPFKCDVCGIKFMKETHLTSHRTSTRCINNHLKVALKRHQESEADGKTHYYVTEEIVQKPTDAVLRHKKYLAVDAKALIGNVCNEDAVKLAEFSDIDVNGDKNKLSSEKSDEVEETETSCEINEAGIENTCDNNEDLGDSNENVSKEESHAKLNIGNDIIENKEGSKRILNENSPKEIISNHEDFYTNEKPTFEMCALPDLGGDCDD